MTAAKRDIRIQRESSVEEGLELIRAHHLYLDDWHASHTRMVLDAHDERDTMASPAQAIWIARSNKGEPVGAAMVCQGTEGSGGKDTVSLFVLPAWRGMGIGGELLERAMARFPNLAGFHTAQAQGLYGRVGLDVAFFFREDHDHAWSDAPGADGPPRRRAPGA